MSPAAFKKREYDGFALQRAVVGPIATNVFFLINTKTNEVLLADPGDEAPLIIRYIKDNGYTLRGILLTHGHWDHTLAVQTLREEFACPVLAHEGEAGLLADPAKNGSDKLNTPVRLSADRLLKEGDELTLAGLHFKVLHTPGHTAGSCCYYFPDYSLLISGDTLFHGSYGRTDLPTGNDAQMLFSIRRLLTELPEDTLVWPGHMDRTAIGFEKRFNPLADLI